MCLSGLITTADHCLLEQHNTSVPELSPSAGMPHSELPALLCGANCPSSPGHAILFHSGGCTGANPDPWPPIPHASKDGHILQRTLPDQGSVEGWLHDPGPSNHCWSRTSHQYFWSQYLSATVTKLAGWKLRAADIICVPMWGQPAWE